MVARRSLRRLGLVALAAPLIAAPAADALPVLHTGSTRYIRIVHLGRGQLSVALTGQGRKRFARLMRGPYALDATCTTLANSVQGFSQRSSSAASEAGIGPNGRFSYHTVLDRHSDFCDVGRARVTATRRGVSGEQVPGPVLDSLALTQKGAAFLDEDRLTVTILGVLEGAIFDAQRRADGRFPPASEFVTGPLTTGPRVGALASADGSPPPGSVGFYSDGADHAEAVVLSALGRRLFIDSNAGVISTNVAEHLLRTTSPFR